MKKIAHHQFIFLLFFAFLYFFLTSCGAGYSSQEADPYRSGTEGVVVSFLNAEYVFYDQQYLRLQLKLENKGAFDKPQGKVVLSGYDPGIVKINSEPIALPDDFFGKNQYALEGSVYFVQVPEDGPISLSLGNSYEAILQTSVCYSYQTIATPTVCLLYNPDDNRYICQQDPIQLSSQGAPVAVTEVKQDFTQDHVRFTVTLQHLGDGTVVNAYDMNAFDACPYGLDRNNVNHVGVSMEISGLGEPSCFPNSGYVSLNQDGTGIIICTFTLREQRTYTTPLKIILDYNYLDVKQQGISIYKSSSAVEDNTAVGGSGNYASNNDCSCSDANLKKWGGCVCLYISGQMYYCSEGTTQIPVSANDDTIEYEIYGSTTVNMCGDSVHPTSSCPYRGTTYVSKDPKKLSIYGTVTDSRTVSERCTLVPQ